MKSSKFSDYLFEKKIIFFKNDPKNPRIEWIDAARGIGIILVVFGHVERGLFSSNIIHGPYWNWLDFSIYSFHMPLFFFLAGMNAPKSLRKGWSSFLTGKVTSVVYPYFLWSIAQGLLLIEMSQFTNQKATFSELFCIGWKPMSQFWFLYALMLCHIAMALIGVDLRRLLPMGILAVIASQLFPENAIVARSLHSFEFYAAGALLVQGNITSSLKYDNRLLVSTFLLMLISLYFSGILSGFDFESIIVVPSAFLGIIMVILISNSLKKSLACAACYLGNASMTIFVLHISVASGARIAITQSHLHVGAWFYLISCTLLGVAVPLFAYRVLSKRDWLFPLGLGPRRAPV
jgi:fucose 4-O-acetylase-like acetyltransferase